MEQKNSRFSSPRWILVPLSLLGTSAVCLRYIDEGHRLPVEGLVAVGSVRFIAAPFFIGVAVFAFRDFLGGRDGLLASLYRMWEGIVKLGTKPAPGEKRFSLSKPHPGQLQVISLLTNGIGGQLWVASAVLTDGATSTAFGACIPAALVLFFSEVLYDEGPKVRHWIATGLIVIGIIGLYKEKGDTAALGLSLGVVTGLLFGVGFLVAALMGSKFKTESIAFRTQLRVHAVGIGALLSGLATIPWVLSYRWGLGTLIAAIVMGGLGFAVPQILFSGVMAQQQTAEKINDVSVLARLEPIFPAAYLWILGQHSFSFYEILAGLVIILGACIGIFRRNGGQQKKKEGG